MASSASPLNIYFCGSIRGQAVDKKVYKAIIKHLQTHGKVLTEHVGADIPESKDITDEEIYLRDVSWLEKSDIVVADVSAASLGVGYELAYAEKLKIKTMCLYSRQDKACSAMITGNKYFEFHQYVNLAQAKEFIDDFVKRYSN